MLGRVATAKQEVARQTNQGCRANTDSSHFVAIHVPVLGFIVPIITFSLDTIGCQSHR